MKTAAACLAVAVCLLTMFLPLDAQVAPIEDNVGAVSGSGTVVLEKLPDTMRLQVAVLSKASSLKEALDGLKERVEAARTQLASLGVDPESIKVGSPKMTSAKTPQQIQMEQMMKQRMKRSGRKGAAEPAKSPVIVSVDLTAEWKLNAKSAEELLLASHPLQEKIRAADLSGAADVTKLSAEEQEQLEEAETEYGGFSSDGESKPGEPIFFFVAKFSDEEIDKALAEGYQKSKADAQRISKAAGLNLGPLVNISHNVTGDNDYSGVNMYSYGNPGYSSEIYQHLQQMRSDSSETSEGVGIQPDVVKHNVTVSSTFRLSPE